MTHEEKEKGLRKIEREEYVQGTEHPFGACFKNQVVHTMVYFFPNAVSLLNDGGQIILTNTYPNSIFVQMCEYYQWSRIIYELCLYIFMVL